jgi:S-adenosylmethionine decarboxylase
MKDLAPDIVRQRLLIEGLYESEIDEAAVKRYLFEVAARLGLRTYGEPIVHSPGGAGKDSNEGFDAFIPLIDSGISLYVWTKRRFFATVLFTCKNFDTAAAVDFTRGYFRSQAIEQREF